MTNQVPNTPVQTIAGWDQVINTLRDLPGRVLAKLPESQRNDPQVQQEVGRLVLSGLTSSGLRVLGGDVEHPMFLPATGPIFGTGQPNADTIYRMANIAPTGVYRLRGRRGTLRIAKIAQHGASPGDPVSSPGHVGPAKGVHDLNDLHVDAQGRFDVILSPERPADYTGDWWRLEPSTAKLMLRFISSDWANEQDPTICIERLDKPVSRPRPSAAELERRLHLLSEATSFISLLLVGDPEQLRSEGYVNKLREHTLDRGMLAGQYYYYGTYDLRDDEALIVEAKVPNKCAYRSMILTNHLYETTDWYNNHSSLNDSQATPDNDGVLRIVVSTKDPGVPNWLDTAGYPQGMIQGRWMDCDSKPVPTVQKVALADVRKLLPAATPTISPEERERVTRERRAAFLQRPLW